MRPPRVERRGRRRLLALAAALTLLLTSCSAPPPPAASAPRASPPTAQGGGNLRIGQAADIVSLDPWNVGDQTSLLVARQLYDTLVGHDPGSLRIVPRLATRWESAADGRTWTFTLREGVRFHDGSALDAAAIAYNFDRARDAGHVARGKGNGFALFADRWSVDGEALLTRVSAPDPRTVVFSLRSAFGPFLAELASPAFGIVSPRSMEADPDGWMLPASRGAAGTGPFRFVPGAWQRDQQLILERNAGYWQVDERGLPLPYLDRLTFRVAPDAAARAGELRAGALDVLRDISPQDVSTMRGSPNLALLGRPPLGTLYLGVTHTRPPFDQVEVRRAVAAALNRQAIVQAAYGAEGRTASQLIPPGLLGHDDSVADFHKFDEAAAKKLLADADLARGFETELWYSPPSRADEPDTRKIALAIAADLARVGIKAQLRPTEAGRSGRALEEQRFPLYIGDRSPTTADPDDVLLPWWDPQTRALLRQARIEMSESKRAELYKQVSKILQQQVPRVPLFHPARSIATTRKVSGLVPHATGGESFTRVSLGR